MASVNWVIAASLNLLLRPLRDTHPLLPLSLLSVLAGLAMLVVWRYTSDQQAMRQVKRRMTAHWLELRLFKDDTAAMLAAQKRLFWLNMVRLRYTLTPLLIMIVPMALLLIHLDGWFAYRPLRPGEAAIVTMRVVGHAGHLLDHMTLQTDPGLAVETPPLRMPDAGEVAWRIRAQTVGDHRVRIHIAGGQTVSKTVAVSDDLLHVSRRKVRFGFWDTLLNPGEPPLSRHTGVAAIEVQYPTRSIVIAGWQTHWLVVFFIVSMVCGYMVKGIWRVEL